MIRPRNHIDNGAIMTYIFIKYLSHPKIEDIYFESTGTNQ